MYTAIFLLTMAAPLASAENPAPAAHFDNLDSLKAWTFWNGPEFPGAQGSIKWDSAAGHEHAGSLAIHFSFAGGGNYVQASWNLPQPSSAKTLNVWIKKTTGHHVTFRATDSTGQTFQKTADYDYPDWQQVELNLNHWTSHWGGANDGKMHFPVKAIGVLVENSAEPREGTVWVDDVAFVDQVTATAPAKTTEIVELRPDVQETPAEVKFSLQLKNNRPSPAKGKLICEYRHLARRLGVQTKEVDLPAAGKAIRQEFTFPRGKEHMVEATFHWQEPGLVVAPVSIGTSRPPPDAGSSKLEPESLLGCGLYLYRWHGNPQARENMTRIAELAQAAGIKWTREEFQWNAIEPQSGNFRFDFYDQVVETAHAHGISVYGLLCYWAPWAKANTQEGIDQYCNWVRQVVRHYKDKVHYWEIWNEPNIFFWTGPKELYATLLTQAYAAVKAEDPTAQVMGCSTSGIDTKFIQMVMDKGGKFDVLTIHPYRGRLEDLQYIRELQDVRKLVGGREVWLTEIGFPSQLLTGWSEHNQASLAARTYLASLASGAIRNVSWYDFRNDGTDVLYNENNFGVIRSDLRLKPAYRALATVCRTLGGMQVKETLDIGAGAYAFRFNDNRHDVIAACAPDNGRLLSFKTDAELKIVDGFGEEVRPVRREQSSTVTLDTGFPIFISGPGNFAFAPQEAAARLVVDMRNVRPGDTVRIRIEPAQAIGEWDLPQGWTTASDKIGLYELRLPPDAPAGRTDLSAMIGKDTPLRLPFTLNVVATVIRI